LPGKVATFNVESFCRKVAAWPTVVDVRVACGRSRRRAGQGVVQQWDAVPRPTDHTVGQLTTMGGDPDIYRAPHVHELQRDRAKSAGEGRGTLRSLATAQRPAALTIAVCPAPGVPANPSSKN